MGTRILHQRLRGPAVASYYPPRIGTISQLRSLYPEHEVMDEEEEDWVEHLNVATSRGKGAPKKKRTAAGEYPACDQAAKRFLATCLIVRRIQEIQQAEVAAKTRYSVQIYALRSRDLHLTSCSSSPLLA